MRMEIRELMKAVNKDGHNYYTEIYSIEFYGPIATTLE